MVVYTGRIGRRLIAYSLDSVVVGLCFLPVWIQLLGSYFQNQALTVNPVWILLSVLLQLFYKWLFLYFLGGTLGKLLLGLRVVPIHEPEKGLGLMQSFLRVLTDSLSLFFGHSLRAVALLRLDRTHVSDWVAETRVVQFSHPRSPTKRHWILAIGIMVFSFINQFQSLYHLVQRVQFVEGQVVWDMSKET